MRFVSKEYTHTPCFAGKHDRHGVCCAAARCKDPKLRCASLCFPIEMQCRFMLARVYCRMSCFSRLGRAYILCSPAEKQLDKVQISQSHPSPRASQHHGNLLRDRDEAGGPLGRSELHADPKASRRPDVLLDPEVESASCQDDHRQKA